MSAIGDIQGSVLSELGSLIGSAGVACNGKKTITLFDGTFCLKDIEPGTYTITASLKGFKSQSRQVTIGKDSKTAVDFRLSLAHGTSKISGMVYDAETKKPLTCGTVIMILPLTNRYAQINNGFYEFDALVGDSYDLVTSLEGYENGKATVAVKENERIKHDFSCKQAVVVEPLWG